MLLKCISKKIYDEFSTIRDKSYKKNWEKTANFNRLFGTHKNYTYLIYKDIETSLDIDDKIKEILSETKLSSKDIEKIVLGYKLNLSQNEDRRKFLLKTPSLLGLVVVALKFIKFEYIDVVLYCFVIALLIFSFFSISEIIKLHHNKSKLEELINYLEAYK